MMTGKNPPHVTMELVKKLGSSEKPAYPDYVKKIHHWMAQVTDGFYKGYAVYEIPDDKFVEGTMALARRYHFYTSVPGYTYKMEVLMPAEKTITNLMGYTS